MIISFMAALQAASATPPAILPDCIPSAEPAKKRQSHLHACYISYTCNPCMYIYIYQNHSCKTCQGIDEPTEMALQTPHVAPDDEKELLEIYDLSSKDCCLSNTCLKT